MQREKIDHAELLRLVRYDAGAGKFYRIAWRAPRSRALIAYAAERETGNVRSNGYVQINIMGTIYAGHRLAWFYVHEEWPKEIDHINGDRVDNRIANLRNGSHAANCQNIRAPKSHNKTGLLGVSWDSDRGKFTAGLSVDGKRKALGRFDTAEEAHAAYLDAKRELHEFATV